MNTVFQNDELQKIKKILVIQLEPIGDALLTTSYFKTLKNRIPKAELHYLIFKKHKKAINNHSMIDRIIEIDAFNGIGYYTERIKKIIKIRQQKYDLVIDQQNLPATQLITLLSGAKYRLGYADARFNFAYNLKAKRGLKRYSASKKYDIIAPLGINEEKYELFFHVSSVAKNKINKWLSDNSLTPDSFICISPGSPVKKKKWKIENYIGLGKLLSTKMNFPIVVVWAPNEFKDAEMVMQQIGLNCILAPKTNLEEVSALIKLSKLLICNDGGLNHLAVAARAKTLAIFGSTDPVDWSPASEFETHHHLFNEHVKDNDCDNSFGITVEDAFKKVQQILSVSIE